MDTQRNIFFGCLHSIGFSQKHLCLVHDRGYDPQDVLANPSDYFTSLGIRDDTRSKISDAQKLFCRERYQQTLQQHRITIHVRDDSGYPGLLSEIPTAPALIYTQGSLLEQHHRYLAVVGSRKYSPHAVASLERILPEIIGRGYWIVSGGAYGLDSISHGISVRENAPTCVVIACGLDQWYPQGNHRLFQRVLETGGCILSPFALGESIQSYTFPIRNEVVAGLSRGVLIAQAARDSGTLITARLAIESNRDVFVIPSDITRIGALGSNELIRDGLGKLVTSAHDILCEYEKSDLLTDLRRNIPTFDHPMHHQIYELLLGSDLLIDDIVASLCEPLHTIQTHVSIMEVRGHIRRRADGKLGIVS